MTIKVLCLSSFFRNKEDWQRTTLPRMSTFGVFTFALFSPTRLLESFLRSVLVGMLGPDSVHEFSHGMDGLATWRRLSFMGLSSFKMAWACLVFIQPFMRDPVSNAENYTYHNVEIYEKNWMAWEQWDSCIECITLFFFL